MRIRQKLHLQNYGHGEGVEEGTGRAEFRETRGKTLTEGCGVGRVSTSQSHSSHVSTQRPREVKELNTHVQMGESLGNMVLSMETQVV